MEMWYTAMTILMAAVLLAAVVWDSRARRIPNALTLGAVAVGVLLNGIRDGGAGVMFALAGAGVGTAVFLVPFVLGGIGGGDVKLLAAVGSIQGPRFVFVTFLCTAIVGGLAALVRVALRRGEWKLAWARLGRSLSQLSAGVVPAPDDPAAGFPYAVCIAVGAAAAFAAQPLLPF